MPIINCSRNSESFKIIYFFLNFESGGLFKKLVSMFFLFIFVHCVFSNSLLAMFIILSEIKKYM